MLRIPINGQSATNEDKFLDISSSSLPNDINRLIYILQREKVPIGFWYQLAVSYRYAYDLKKLMYHKSGNISSFAHILTTALSEEDKRGNPHLFESPDDRIKCFNALSNYYHQLSLSEIQPDKYQKWHEESIRNLNNADSIYIASTENWTTKTYYLIAQGELAQAQQYMDNLKSSSLKNNPIIFWLQGLIDFAKGNIQDCLKNLKQVVELNPRSPPQIRFGIGLCYYRLGNLNKARFAFQRVLELDPSHSMANTALAILDLQVAHTDPSDETRLRVVQLLEKAFQSNNNNPLALKYLAEHYLQVREFEIAQGICDQALKVLETYRRPENIVRENPNYRKEMEFLKSDIYFIMGKIQHIQRNFNQALDHYIKATKFNDRNLPAQFNLGKVYYFNDSFQQAEACFEMIVQSPKHKDCFEALRLLAQTKGRLGKNQECVAYFKRVLELNPKDFEANIEIAQIHEQTDSKIALFYYENALKIANNNIEERKRNNQDTDNENTVVPPEILVNVGTLRLEVGKIHEAFQAFQQAIDAATLLLSTTNPQGETLNKLLAIRITAKFNLAYWYEQHNNNQGRASEIYKEIIQEEPTYLDAYLRLSYLARDRGDFRKSWELLENAKIQANKQQPVYQFCMKGKILSDQCFTNEAQNEFKTLQDKIIKRFDSYVVLSIASLYYEWSTRCRENNVAQQGDLLRRAMEKYIQVLENDESNVFASIGVASVLAEHNKVNEAIEILKGVKEASPMHIQMPNVLINLAHMNIVLQNYEVAINLYSKALEKFPPGRGDLETELYLAKAYFLSESFDQCQKRLKSLAMRYPSDLRVRYDLAICLYEQAQNTFNKDVRKVAETEQAIQNLRHAQKLMEFILSTQWALPFMQSHPSQELNELYQGQLNHMKKICEERLGDLKEMIFQSNSYLEADTKHEETMKAEEDQKAQKIHSLQMIAEQERSRKRQQEQLRLLEEQRIADEIANSHKETLEQIAAQCVKQPKRGPNKKEGRRDDDDMFEANQAREELSHHSEGNLGSNGLFGGESEENDGDYQGDEGSSERQKREKKEKKEKKKHKKHKKDKKHKKHHKRGEGEEDGEPRKEKRRLKKIREDANEDEDIPPGDENVAMHEEEEEKVRVEEGQKDDANME